MFRLSRDILIGFLLVCAAAWGLMYTRTLRFADQSLYDAQARWLRANAPTPLAHDVVVIGIDEAAYEAIPEPTALWHTHLGALFAGLSAAKPAVVGLAMPLPVRSYDFLVKDIDAPLIAGIYLLRGAAPLVVGQPLGVGARLRPIAPGLLAAIGEDAVASLAICEDTDGTVRRINQRRCRSEDKREPLASAMAKHLGRQGSPSGMIDYSTGGAIEYTPVGMVLDWIHRGDDAKLRALVQGRAVVVANLLPTETRHRLPVPLTAWEPGSRTEPGAVVHIQALRSLLGRGTDRTSAGKPLTVPRHSRCAALVRSRRLDQDSSAGRRHRRLCRRLHLRALAWQLFTRGEHCHCHAAGLHVATGMGFHPQFS